MYMRIYQCDCHWLIRVDPARSVYFSISPGVHPRLWTWSAPADAESRVHSTAVAVDTTLFKSLGGTAFLGHRHMIKDIRHFFVPRNPPWAALLAAGLALGAANDWMMIFQRMFECFFMNLNNGIWTHWSINLRNCRKISHFQSLTMDQPLSHVQSSTDWT